MRTKKEQIDLIIQSLEAIKIRPAMYFGSQDNINLARNYLFGIRHAVILLLDLDKTSHITIWDETARKAGHNFSPLGVSQKMKNEFLTDAEKVQEYLEIEIEFWKIYRDNLENFSGK